LSTGSSSRSSRAESTHTGCTRPRGYFDYYSLKKHVAAATGPSGGQVSRCRRATEDSIPFIELVPSAAAGVPEYLLELEDPRGAQMRIEPVDFRQGIDGLTR
jgi:hypothetical protein